MDNIIKGSIVVYRNSISENNIQTPDIGKDHIISQLAFSFDIESDKIDNISEELYPGRKRPDYDKSLSNNVYNKSFDTFLGLYVELPGDEK